MSITSWAGNTLREFRHALRMLRTKPAFSGTVILTLALGMGATTAIFSVVNGVIIKPLPYPDSDEVVIVMHSALFGTQRSDGFPFSPQMLEVYAAEGRAFEEIGILRQGQAAVTGDGDPNQANTLLVSQGILPSFGVAPMLGRWFSREDDQPGAAETAVLSYGYWQARLGGDRNVIGRTLTIDGRPREVIGVMPAGMPFYLTQADIVLPLQIDMLAPPPDFDYAGMARLKPGFSVDDANADIARMLPMYIDKYTGGQMDALELQPAVRSFKQNVVGNVGQVLWLLLGSISILLLIACANVANLLLVRTETRGTELAVRTALGAGPGHLARGLIVESLTLSLIGGLAGVGLALVGLPLLLEIAPAGLPRLGEITIDVSVLVFAFGVSILAGLFFGLFPVLKLAGQRFVASIGEFIQGGRWSSAGKRQQRSQNTLVVVQVALALVMLVGSGLMLRTFQNLRGVEPGFTDPSTIQTARVSMPDVMFGEPEAVVRLQTQIRERLAAIPGVTSAAYISSLPMEGIGGSVVYVRDKTYAADEVPPARRVKMMSPGLLRTFGTPLLVGRDFEWIELEEQRNVAMVSASFARAEWGTVDGALGRFIRIGTTGGWQEVIGVVADVYDDGVDQDVPPTVYWPAREHEFIVGTTLPMAVSFVLRTDRVGTESMYRDIRQAVSEVAPDLPITQVRPMTEIVDASMARTAFSLVLLGIAGAMSLAISIVGIYGVLAYAVMQRQHEVGIRVALGAEPAAIRKMFVVRGMMLSGSGIAVGAMIAVGVTRLMSALLYGVEPIDLATFLAAAAFLALAALLASYIPARRAAALEPAETLSGR